MSHLLNISNENKSSENKKIGLASPDQLDRTIVITSPLSWLVIIGVAVITVAFLVWAVIGTLPTTVNYNGILVNGKNIIPIYSEYSGTVVENYMTVGKEIKKGDTLCVLSENGAEEAVISSQNGTVSEIVLDDDYEVNKYDVIAKLNVDTTDERVLVEYLPVDIGKTIQTGMKAVVSPASTDEQKYGYMEAEVIYVDDYVTSDEDILSVIGRNNKLNSLLISDDSPMVTVVLKLKKDESSKNGYYWSSAKGRTIDVTEGTVFQVKLITNESSPISKLLPALDKEA